MIRVSRLPDDHVGVVAIDRPEKKNALTPEMWSSAAEALGELSADDGISVVLLTGAGDVFSAGADTSDWRADVDAGGPFHAFLDALDGFAKPLVAAVNGAAVGAGLTMLCYCDLVLASTTARFKLPLVPMGLSPEAGSSRLLPERIGWQEAAHLFFTGDWLDAADARQAGLVWRTYPPATLRPEAEALCRSIGAMPLDALRETKRLLVTAGRDAGPVRRRESEVFRRLLASRKEPA